ncbi:MAG: GNAT family N-acetyltransferase [Oscillospiraceae bacterium]|jgi:GNAT superfamily N-acetyltransferase|nr:GNAT family N-acetyltransferase [Oscillospiraceae bacterium]
MPGDVRVTASPVATRTAAPGDARLLRAIWQAAFEDEDAEISDFFDSFGGSVVSVIAEIRGEAAAAGHMAPAGSLVSPGGVRTPCAMLYSIAALPEMRGLGGGAAVTRALTRRAAELGFPAAVLKPADDGLFEYYSGRAGFREWFYASERKFHASELPRVAAADARRVTPREYGDLREGLLRGVTHIDAGGGALEYQRRLCERSGGGLFGISAGGLTACAAVERRDGGALSVKELLIPPGAPPSAAAVCAAALARRLPAEEIDVRTPATDVPPPGAQDGGARRFGMLYTATDAPAPGARRPGGWYGFAFD